MNIQYASDLHLEFRANSEWLEQNPIAPLGDVLVLAGDIGYLGRETYGEHPFWDYVSQHFRQTLVVPGNHEFYRGFDVRQAVGQSGQIRPNVSWHYNQAVVVDDVEFILSPLWSFIPPAAHSLLKSRLADFSYIELDGERLRPTDFNALHAECLDFLRRTFARPKAGKRVVATHHVPTERCTADEFRSGAINCGFTSEQEELIRLSDANLWIYGHSHRNLSPQWVGTTPVACNQLGYVEYGEHHSFKNSMQKM